MTIDELIDLIENKAPAAPEAEVQTFERKIGAILPADYRAFLLRANGGSINGCLLCPTTQIQTIGGLRPEPYLSLATMHAMGRGCIPAELLWMMGDPFGNALCIGIDGQVYGKVFFWVHDIESNAAQWRWSSKSEGTVKSVADSFTDFVARLTFVAHSALE